MTKEEMVKELLGTYSEKLFLDRDRELYGRIEAAAAALPEELVKEYLLDVLKLNRRPDTPEGEKAGRNKLEAMYRKMTAKVIVGTDPLRGTKIYMQDGVNLDSMRFEVMLNDMQQTVDKLGGDREITESLAASDRARCERMAKEGRKSAVEKTAAQAKLLEEAKKGVEAAFREAGVSVSGPDNTRLR